MNALFSSVFVSLFIFSSSLLACSPENTLAILQKVEGLVKLHQHKTLKPKTAKPGKTYPLCAKDKVITFDGKASIFSQQGDVFVLDKQSALLLNSLNEVAAEGKNALFNIQPRLKTAPLMVKTTFSTIGVKGTEFLVSLKASGQQDLTNQQAHNEIAMTKGMVEVTSAQMGQFELFVQKQQAAYNQFTNQQQSALDAMQKQMDAEFNQFVATGQLYESKGKVDSVELKAGQSLAISNTQAYKSASLSSQSQAKIKQLKAFGF